MQGSADANEARHCVHRVVVDERRRVESSGRHDGHQFGDGQRLRLDQSLSLAHVHAEDLLKAAGINFAQQI